MKGLQAAHPSHPASPPRICTRGALWIVARIDELFAEVDDGEAALRRARSDLETWRKSPLKAATGELTAESANVAEQAWRWPICSPRRFAESVSRQTAAIWPSIVGPWDGSVR